MCLCLCWSLWTTAYQVRAICGEYGIYPITPVLVTLKRDFPSWRRFFYWPTLLWINSSDTAIVGLLTIGGGCALYGALFGPQLWMVVIAWSALISTNRAANILWPWDNFLSEITFLMFFLPYSNTRAPNALVCWSFRWLIFRLMHGFGKLKFTGQHPKNDKLYLKAFYTFQV
jgi:hypothetical protein